MPASHHHLASLRLPKEGTSEICPLLSTERVGNSPAAGPGDDQSKFHAAPFFTVSAGRKPTLMGEQAALFCNYTSHRSPDKRVKGVYAFCWALRMFVWVRPSGSMSLMGAIRYFNSNESMHSGWSFLCVLGAADKESQAIFSPQTMQITRDSDMRINLITLFFAVVAVGNCQSARVTLLNISHLLEGWEDLLVYFFEILCGSAQLYHMIFRQYCRYSLALFNFAYCYGDIIFNTKSKKLLIKPLFMFISCQLYYLLSAHIIRICIKYFQIWAQSLILLWLWRM